MSQNNRYGWIDQLFFWGSIGLAVWVILSAFIFDFGAPRMFWSNIISGGIVLGVCGRDYERLENNLSIRGATQFIVLLVGFWLMFSPFYLLSEVYGWTTWTNIAPGLFIVLFAGGEAVIRSSLTP